MTAFRDLINHAAARVDNTASTGQAAYNSMALEIIMSSLIKSTEDLLSLTRQLRELWVVGPLRRPGEDDERAEAAARRDAGAVLALLNALRDGQRQRLLVRTTAAAAGGGKAGGPPTLTLERAPADGVPPPPAQAVVSAAAAAPAAAATAGQEQGQGVTPLAGDVKVKKEEAGV